MCGIGLVACAVGVCCLKRRWENGEISCVVVRWLSARLVKLIKIHLGFECVEGVGHKCKFPGQVVHCGGSRTNKRYPSIFLHSLSMAVGGGVVVLPESADSVSHCGRVYEERRVRAPFTVVTASPAPKFFSQGVLSCHRAKLLVCWACRLLSI
eukprot:g7636.t1